jgi:hypothetical protein
MNQKRNPEHILTIVERGISRINWLDRLVNAVADRLIPQAIATASACGGGWISSGPGGFCHYGWCQFIHGMCQRPAIYQLRVYYSGGNWCDFPCPVNNEDPAYTEWVDCAPGEHCMNSVEV